jgi:hypothetical protein
MLIRNRHTQKTQPSQAKKKRGIEREHVFIRISIPNKTTQTINEREPLGLPHE